MAQTLADLIDLKELSPDKYVTLYNPQQMGNTKAIAYGGCTLAVGVNTVHQTVRSELHLYSILGNFLGGALTDRPLYATVRRVRDTRTFATRQVEISQRQDDGSERLCLMMLADFHVAEKSVLEYSAPPDHAFVPVDECPSAAEAYDILTSRGTVTGKHIAVHKSLFQLGEQMFEQRAVPGTVMTQNLLGLAKEAPTSQDRLPLPSKTSSLWFRAPATAPLTGAAEQLSALAFQMDGALSFLPLSHSHMFLDDVAACSSLDFALRFFQAHIDVNDWHLKEMKTVAGGEGRAYSEARCWNSNGKLVANMTQQCILRPLPRKEKL